MNPLGPGAVIGIIGGGQLARMMAVEGRRMGYEIAVQDPDPTAPAVAVSDHFVEAALDDVVAAQRLAGVSDVITIDTEHVPAELLARLETEKPVHPSATVMRIIQDRLEQRRFFAAHGFPQTPNAPVDDIESLRGATRAIGFPCVLKARRWGYDGKGQARITHEGEIEEAWLSIDNAPAVLEAFVDFEKEVSVLLARDVGGSARSYPLVENHHRRHILHTSRVPALVSADLSSEAVELAEAIGAALGHVGVMAVELFVTRDGRLLINEVAPRVHNSGHYTLGACVTSQFEQHLRAICGLPLGDPALMRPAVMVNLLGDLWCGGPPRWSTILAHPGARLHLYGKARAMSGRKMGHVVIFDDDPDSALALAETWMTELRAGETTPPNRISDGIATQTSTEFP